MHEKSKEIPCFLINDNPENFIGFQFYFVAYFEKVDNRRFGFTWVCND